MEVADDAWASLLPGELLLDIFRRLEATAVISSASACKPWRRAIMGNASTLRPRPDIFVPNRLRGFVLEYISVSNGCVWLLSSRDGFLLTKCCRRGNGTFDGDLCLWNSVTDDCTFLPMASFGGGGGERQTYYILVTGYDDLQTVSTSGELEVRILAVQVTDGGGGRSSFHYQLFTAKSGSRSGGGGTWRPVERSQDFDGSIIITTSMQENTEVVCRGGAVHWLSWSCPCTVALDVRTGRSWTTVLPLGGIPCRGAVVLATSSDGRRLSVMRWLKERQGIQVWVLTLTASGDQWILRRVVDVRKLLPGPIFWVWLNVFCPRSGCLRVQVNGQDLLVDVERGSSYHIHLDWRSTRPYEMDWSSYWSMCWSKMKYF